MITEQEARDAAKRCELQQNKGLQEYYDDELTLYRWAIQELARREAERAERARPIDAEWLLSLGECICDDKDAFGVRLSPAATAIMERPNVALSLLQKQPSTIVHGRIGNQKVSVVATTRGQLLDILAALKGGAT